MFDILKLMYPDASPLELTLLSNFCVFLGCFLLSLGLFATVIESIYQKKLFYEGFPLILLSLFVIIVMGMHSNISIFSFLNANQILTSVVSIN